MLLNIVENYLVPFNHIQPSSTTFNFLQ